MIFHHCGMQSNLILSFLKKIWAGESVYGVKIACLEATGLPPLLLSGVF